MTTRLPDDQVTTKQPDDQMITRQPDDQITTKQPDEQIPDENKNLGFSLRAGFGTIVSIAISLITILMV